MGFVHLLKVDMLAPFTARLVCARDGDRSRLYKEGLKYQKELHSQKVLPQLSPETTLQ